MSDYELSEEDIDDIQQEKSNKPLSKNAVSKEVKNADSGDEDSEEFEEIDSGDEDSEEFEEIDSDDDFGEIETPKNPRH